MNIYWSTWEPGLSGNQMTSGGGAVWTKYLFEEFRNAGHFVYSPNHIFTFESDLDSHFGKYSVMVFCWRWQFPQEPYYQDRNTVYENQMRLIKFCGDRDIPFIVHDQDLKMTKKDEQFVTSNHGLITEPSFYPPGHRISLHFPNPYPTSIPTESGGRGLVYIGNNYERMEQTVKFLGRFSEERVVTVYGNWLEEGKGRATPDEVKRALPLVNFKGRLSQMDVIPVLRNAKATILLHKPEYGPRGFVTIRWAEAAAANIIPFIPQEFRIPLAYQKLLEPLQVIDSQDLLRKYNSITSQLKEEMIDNFKVLVYRYMSAKPWIQLLERIAK